MSIFWKKKNAKIKERSHAYKGHSSCYNVNILNYFNPKLQLKATKSTIRTKLINLLSELGDFKFVRTLVIDWIIDISYRLDYYRLSHRS